MIDDCPFCKSDLELSRALSDAQHFLVCDRCDQDFVIEFLNNKITYWHRKIVCDIDNKIYTLDCNSDTYNDDKLKEFFEINLNSFQNNNPILRVDIWYPYNHDTFPEDSKKLFYKYMNLGIFF